jgi:hypothetical protein
MAILNQGLAKEKISQKMALGSSCKKFALKTSKHLQAIMNMTSEVVVN